MRPVWRLAISSLAGSRRRTALLSAAVALAAALITAVASGMASVSTSMTERLDTAVGRADVSLAHVAGAAFDPGILDAIEAWPEPLAVAPRAVGPLPLKLGDEEITANGAGVDPAVESLLHRYSLAEGRFVENPGEVVLEYRLAKALGAHTGDTLGVPRFGAPIELRVVGVLAPEALNKLARRWAYVTRDQLAAHDPLAVNLTRVDIDLPDTTDVKRFIATHQPGLPRGLILEPTERISAGLTQNIRVFQIGLLIWTVFAFLAASFIILTGLTTSVDERQRELAVVRCIGGTRAQIGAAQLMVGAFVGAAGALVGVPLGLALAALAAEVYRQHLPGGLVVPPVWMVIAVAGCLVSGLIGAAWPAWRASRLSPLAALSLRATTDAARPIPVFLAVGLVCIALQPVLAFTLTDAQAIYWTYVTAAAPLMLVGYFLLSIPLIVLTSRLLGPLVARLFGLPRSLLLGAVAASPVRHGMTAGSLMTGLALLVAIWTTGRAFLGSWVGAIDFPDAFVHSITGLPPDAQDRLRRLDAVEDTCAISMVTVKTNFLGVQAIKQLGSTFIAFDPEPFFRMTTLDWIEGDAASAKLLLDRGGAVLVAREFAVARGLGVGDTFPFEFRNTHYEMDIAGVISAPGLDLVGKYFDVGAQFKDQALHAVFGTRRDMKTLFGNDAVQFIQIDLSERYTDEEAIAAIRDEFKGTIITVGSGRTIKSNIVSLGASSLRVVSSVAVAAMLIACFGVANVVIAGIQARAYEFGVLRAIGASGATLARLVTAETLLIALAAIVVGTLMGLQASFAESRLWAAIAGIDLGLRLEPDVILLGAVSITVLALLAATPAAVALAKRPPRELLASSR